MDIKVLVDILSIMDTVGINEAVIEPHENGTQIRAANREKNIIVFDTIDEKLVDLPMGVQSVRGLLSRINLFDVDKASIKLKDNEREIQEAKINVGRKRASFKCARRDMLAVPKMIPGDLSMTDVLELSDEYVRYLSTAIAAMSYTGDKKERTLSMEMDEGSDLAITISDGEDDSFKDILDNCPISMQSKASWEVVPFERVMKASLDANEGVAKMSVSEHNIAIFDVGSIRVMVAPLV